MAKDKVQIIQINTDPAKKSLKDLRKELKDLKDEMVNLEEGSDAFLEVAQKAGEVKHQIDEISESVKGASSDFGDMVGNISNVTAGLVGAFSAVQGGLQAMGFESKAIDESIKQMQGLMAVVQGLGQIDTAIKSLNKLQKSITSSTKAAQLLKAALTPKTFLAIAAAITAVTLVFNKLKTAQEEARIAQEEYNKKLEEENRIRRESNVKDFLRSLNTELRVKEAIASVKYEDDELKYKKEMLHEYILEMNRAKIELDNVIAIGPNSSAWAAVGKDYQTELQKWKQYAEQLSALVQQTKDDITVLEARAAEEAKKPKPKTPTTPVEDNNIIQPFEGILDITDKINQKLEEKYDIQLEKLKRSNKSNAEKLKEEIEIEKKRLALYTEGTLEYEKQLTYIFDLEQDFADQFGEKVKSKLDAIEDMGNQMFETLKSTMDMFSESSLGLTGNWTAALDDFQTAFTQTMAIVKTEGKSSWTAYGDVAATALNGIGTLLNALSNEQDASNEEGFEKMKKLQIAATVMNMLSGIMSAWTSAMSPSNAWMTIWGQIAMGTAMSGMIAGIGAAQIAKIKSQTRESANPNTNINAKAVGSMIVPPVQHSQAVQGANTEGAIQNQKVYVTESDIVGTINKVSVQENENTY